MASAVAQRHDEDLIGSTVAGGYRLTGKLGQGGFGSVYSGRDANGESVAVKVFSRAQGLASRADREARTASKLAHPNIHQVVAVEHDDEHAFLISRLVVGERFDRTELSDLEAVRAIAAVCDALSHAHARGVIHRDVKPANILVSVDGEVTLTDFGIARDEDAADQTLDERLLGTLSWMAPEQAAGERAGPASDVWAAALTLYARLTGANPYRSHTLAELLERLGGGAQPLQRARPDLPAGVASAVESALHRDPRKRPQAAELRDLLIEAARTAELHDDRLGAAPEVADLPLLRALPVIDPDAPGVLMATRLAAAVVVGSGVATLLAVFPMYPPAWTLPLAGLLGLVAFRAPGFAAAAAVAVCLPAFWNFSQAAGLAFAGLVAVWVVIERRSARSRPLAPLWALPLAAIGAGPAFVVVAASAHSARRRALEALLGGVAVVVVSGSAPAAATAALPGADDPAGLLLALRGAPAAIALIAAMVAAALLLPAVARARGLRRIEFLVAWAVAFFAAVCILPQALGAAPGAVVPAAGAALTAAILAAGWALVSPRLGWGS